MSNSVSDTGIITELEGNIATITFDITDNCKDCGIRFLCAPGSDEQKTIKLENTIGAKIGDEVIVSEASNVLLTLSFLQYGLPLIGFLIGIIISTFLNIIWHPIELFQFLIGIVGLGIAGLISYLIVKRIAKKPDKLYNITKIK